MKYGITKVSMRLEALQECFFCSTDFTITRPAKTISGGNTAGQFTPLHSCLCSAIHSMFESESLGKVIPATYFSRSLDRFLQIPWFLELFLNSCPPACIWQCWEQYSGIEHDVQGTESAGNSLKQKWQWVSRQCFNMICRTQDKERRIFHFSKSSSSGSIETITIGCFDGDEWKNNIYILR